MSRTISKRLLAQSPRVFSEPVPSFQSSSQGIRSISQSASRAAAREDRNSTKPPPQRERGVPRSQSLNRAANVKAYNPGATSMKKLSENFSKMVSENQKRHTPPDSKATQKYEKAMNTNWSSDGSMIAPLMAAPEPVVEPHHFHIQATRHNTHITLTDPKRNPIMSVSCGNLGFKHSARKHYDSAFQLASLVMQQMQDRGINAQIKELAVVLRGFGNGREAVSKALLGLEGKNLRHKIVRVADATRLKFGGTRSKKPRRLG